MGNYLNPGNEGFNKDVNSQIYVDKTGLIKEMNRIVNDSKNCVALSHARRFGKSQAAGMLDAYYSCGYDSRAIFERFAIAKELGWDRYLNKFNVIHLDMSTLAGTYSPDLVDYIKDELCESLQQSYSDVDYSKKIADVLDQIYRVSGIQYVVIIDEWDCIIRNYAHDDKLVHAYMQFLHDIFKSEESKRFLALGYITGILPIKKVKDESALNNFREYTMLNSGRLASFFGFTDDEVRELCKEYDMDYDTVNKWYNGYIINGHHMYNPNSVYQAMLEGVCDSYWKNTSSYESINTFIMLNADCLKDDVLAMLSGGRAPVNTRTFQNDLSVIKSKNDALTALIHLGYLAYDADMEEAFMPNYEVATAYEAALADGGWPEVARSIETAHRALNAMLRGRAEELAHYIDMAHEAYTSIKSYNDENSLYSVLYMALFTARAFYNVERELPAGKGFADMVLIPHRNAGNKPAVVIELKYDQSADTAIRQIKEKRYAGSLSGYADRILLVGINYDKDTKKHECIIEEYRA